MSVPHENSTFCETCSSYNLVDALMVDCKLYCDNCVETGKVKIPKWILANQVKIKWL